MPQAAAYSPAHITGFFEILDTDDEASKRGSLGAGVSLSRGVRTVVLVKKSHKDSLVVRMNGQQKSAAKVSEFVARKYLNMAGGKYTISIDHQFDVPIGTGLGTSGAGALSLSLALNEAFDLDLALTEASQVAHQAEIESKTGLGTVIAETFGGIEVRLKPGAPGVGRIIEIPFNDSLVVIAASFGPISTTHVLSTPWMRSRINGHAHELLWSLVEDPTAWNLLKLSREFADGIGLATPRVRALLSILDELSLQSSMLMMGEGVFTVLPHSDAKRVTSLLRERFPSLPFVISSKIASRGAHLLDS